MAQDGRHVLEPPDVVHGRPAQKIVTEWLKNISADLKSRRLSTSARELKPTTSRVHLVTMGQKGWRLGRERCLSSLDKDSHYSAFVCVIVFAMNDHLMTAFFLSSALSPSVLVLRRLTLSLFFSSPLSLSLIYNKCMLMIYDSL